MLRSLQVKFVVSPKIGFSEQTNPAIVSLRALLQGLTQTTQSTWSHTSSAIFEDPTRVPQMIASEVLLGTPDCWTLLLRNTIFNGPAPKERKGTTSLGPGRLSTWTYTQSQSMLWLFFAADAFPLYQSQSVCFFCNGWIRRWACDCVGVAAWWLCLMYAQPQLRLLPREVFVYKSGSINLIFTTCHNS